MIRSGVTALFETGRTEVSDEEIDILLGRREGVVDNAINEADDERTAKLWQQKDEMQLEASESDSQPRTPIPRECLCGSLTHSRVCSLVS